MYETFDISDSIKKNKYTFNEMKTIGNILFIKKKLYMRTCLSCWQQNYSFTHIMMTSSNGNIFQVTDPLCGEFTGQRWIFLTKASDAELWCFFLSTPQQTVE